MQLSMRWYGPTDPVPLKHLRQVPGVTGVVSALYDLPQGATWPLERVLALRRAVEDAGLTLSVIESIPVPEAVKLGLPARDEFIENYRQSLRHVARAGVRVVCYNFMPVFDWMRTNLALPLPDGSTTLSFAQAELDAIDFSGGTDGLPGWGGAYGAGELAALLEHYVSVGEEQLFQHLVYFLRAVVPVAQEEGVRLALHPDDPPWPIFGLPRIVRDARSIARILDAVPHEASGLTFCTGSLGSQPGNDLPAMVRRFGRRIHFVHARNVRVTGERRFHEVAHPSAYGDVDMRAVMQALVEVGFDGPLRSDHGRMIWGETGKPGYGLHDRALGSAYLLGLLEGVRVPAPPLAQSAP